jgi:TrpR family trp operon transcriptional repressor
MDEKSFNGAVGELVTALAKCTDPKLMANFIRSILTSKELKDVSARWKLVKLIESGLSQRAISKRLGLSLCKITRGSKELKRDDSPFKAMFSLIQDS